MAISYRYLHRYAILEIKIDNLEKDILSVKRDQEWLKGISFQVVLFFKVALRGKIMYNTSLHVN